eukprot:9188194-Pyramimonas_sp.AAC.1
MLCALDASTCEIEAQQHLARVEAESARLKEEAAAAAKQLFAREKVPHERVVYLLVFWPPRVSADPRSPLDSPCA